MDRSSIRQNPFGTAVQSVVLCAVDWIARNGARAGKPDRSRLSAIMAADVAGYSRLMHDDEEATHARLTALLTDVVDPAIAEHGGRIVKHTGDGFLAEFPSAVEAVRAATYFQNSIRDLMTQKTAALLFE